eukprot:g8042.t1
MMEYISPEGLRLDGRRALELRRLHCQFGTVDEAEGSVTFESGNTKILASVFGPHDAGRDRSEAKVGLITCQLSTAPFSTGERRKRSRRDRQMLEFANIVREAFQTNVLVELMPKSRIEVFLHVIEADGGVLSAALNAAFLAAADAGIPMRDLCGACSLGILQNTKLLDLNYLEETGGGPLLTVMYQRHREKILTLQLERSRISIQQLQEGIELALEGCKASADFIRGKLLERTEKLALTRGGGF